MVEVTRTSPFTKKTRTLSLNITAAQYALWERGEPAQVAFANLTPGEREFIMTGITDEEWDTLLPKDPLTSDFE